MGFSHSPKIATDGLAFYYDTGNSPKSYKGKPTSNLLETGTNWSYIGGTITDPNSYPVALPSNVKFHTGGYNTNISWTDACRNYVDSYPAGTKVTVSGWHMAYSTDTSLTIDGRLRLGWHYNKDGVSTYGGTIYTVSEWNKWTYFSNTFSSTGVTTNLRVEDGGYDYYLTAEDAAKTTQYYCNLQIEIGGDIASPYVKGARSVTGSLVDLTGNKTINVSNSSFTSDALTAFDGSGDYFDLGSDQVFKTTGGWTVESIVKYDSVAGGYNNLTSPANFIGSDTNAYNSWYWSVLNNKLALWNKSPGVWKYGSTTLQANTWYHTALVSYDNGTQYQMYLNGVAEGGDHTTYSWNASYSGLRVRYLGAGNSTLRYINGTMPVMKIYDRALTASEIQQNYNALKGRFGL